MKQNSATNFFADGELVKILDFYVQTSDGKNQRLGMNIQKIKEIVEFKDLQPLPPIYAPFSGFFNLRQLPVPVLFLSHILDKPKEISQITQPPVIANANMRIIICEFQRIFIGFLISKVGRIMTIPNSSIHAVPEALNFSNQRIYNGIIKDGEEFVNLLDIETILDSLKIDLGKEKPLKAIKNFAGKKILLVEDSKIFQEKLKRFFDKMGVDLTVANDGLEGLQKLKAANYQFDIIFTDIEMPNLNGIGMVRQIKKISAAANIPVIFNTSISNPGLVEDIAREKLGKYFIKYDEDSILDTITKILSDSESQIINF